MNHITDMTQGSSLKLILRFTLPLLIGNIFQQLYNMVDSVIVGNYVGANALAAVGSCGSVNFLFFSLSSGLAIGIGIMIAQYFGAGMEKEIRRTIMNGAYLLIAASLIVTVISCVFAPQILRLLSTPDEILGDAVIYLRTISAGILFVAFYNGIAAVLRALGDSQSPLYFLILSSIVNVVLDLVFVLQLGWGVFGVGFATLIAQIISAVACLIYACLRVSYFRITREECMLDMDVVGRAFRLGIPVAIQNSMIAVSCIALQGVVNHFGATVMAAYTIIGRIEQIVQQPYASLGTALTNFTGQNIGAGLGGRVKKGYWQCVWMVLIFSIVLIPVAYLFGEQIIGFFVKEPEVIAIGVKALKINSLCYFALGMIYVPRALLNGCGDTAFAVINGFTEVACRIAYSQILTRIPLLGYWGIWITTAATWTTTAVVCVVRYASGVWKGKKLLD
ncbi:MAG: MATE family efflux transporter [Clostridiales bacterium]|nr:MATE family efflux transporter [Clostridiales bacterium]